MANAPQKATRVVAFRTSAPPAFAPTAPSSARKTNEAIETIGISLLDGEISTIKRGSAAPTANVAADVSAACTGLAVLI